MLEPALRPAVQHAWDVASWTHADAGWTVAMLGIAAAS